MPQDIFITKLPKRNSVPVVNTIMFSLARTYSRWLTELLFLAGPSQPPSSLETELSCSRGDGQYASCDISGGQYG